MGFQKKFKIAERMITAFIVLFFVMGLFFPASVVKADYGHWITAPVPLIGGGVDADNTEEVNERAKDDEPNTVTKIMAEMVGYWGTAISQGFRGNEGLDASVTGIIMGKVVNGNSYFVFDLGDDNVWGKIGAIIYIGLRAIMLVLLFVAVVAQVVVPLWKGDSRGGALIKSALLTFVIGITIITVMPLVVDWLCIIRDRLGIVLYKAVNDYTATNSGAYSLGYTASDGSSFMTRVNASLGNYIDVIYYNIYIDKPNMVNALLYLIVCLLPLAFIISYIKLAIIQTVLFGMFPMFAFVGTMDRGESIKKWLVTFATNCMVPCIDLTLIFVPSLLISSMMGNERGFDSSSLIVLITLVVCFFAIVPVRNQILGLFGGGGWGLENGTTLGGLLASAASVAAGAVAGAAGILGDFNKNTEGASKEDLEAAEQSERDLDKDDLGRELSDKANTDPEDLIKDGKDKEKEDGQGFGDGSGANEEGGYFVSKDEDVGEGRESAGEGSGAVNPEMLDLPDDKTAGAGGAEDVTSAGEGGGSDTSGDGTGTTSGGATGDEVISEKDLTDKDGSGADGEGMPEGFNPNAGDDTHGPTHNGDDEKFDAQNSSLNEEILKDVTGDYTPPLTDAEHSKSGNDDAIEKVENEKMVPINPENVVGGEKGDVSQSKDATLGEPPAGDGSGSGDKGDIKGDGAGENVTGAPDAVTYNDVQGGGASSEDSEGGAVTYNDVQGGGASSEDSKGGAGNETADTASEGASGAYTDTANERSSYDGAYSYEAGTKELIEQDSVSGEDMRKAAERDSDSINPGLASQINQSSYVDTSKGIDQSNFNLNRAANLQSMANMGNTIQELDKNTAELKANNVNKTSELRAAQRDLDRFYQANNIQRDENGRYNRREIEERMTSDPGFKQTAQAKIDRINTARDAIEANKDAMAKNSAYKEGLQAEIGRRQGIEKQYADRYAAAGHTGQTFASAEDLAMHLKKEERARNLVSLSNYKDKSFDGVLSESQKIQYQREAAKREAVGRLAAGGAIAAANIAAVPIMVASGNMNAARNVSKAATATAKSIGFDPREPGAIQIAADAGRAGAAGVKAAKKKVAPVVQSMDAQNADYMMHMLKRGQAKVRNANVNPGIDSVPEQTSTNVPNIASNSQAEQARTSQRAIDPGIDAYEARPYDGADSAQRAAEYLQYQNSQTEQATPVPNPKLQSSREQTPTSDPSESQGVPDHVAVFDSHYGRDAYHFHTTAAGRVETMVENGTTFTNLSDDELKSTYGFVNADVDREVAKLKKLETASGGSLVGHTYSFDNVDQSLLRSMALARMGYAAYGQDDGKRFFGEVSHRVDKYQMTPAEKAIVNKATSLSANPGGYYKGQIIDLPAMFGGGTADVKSLFGEEQAKYPQFSAYYDTPDGARVFCNRDNGSVYVRGPEKRYDFTDEQILSRVEELRGSEQVRVAEGKDGLSGFSIKCDTREDYQLTRAALGRMGYGKSITSNYSVNPKDYKFDNYIYDPSQVITINDGGAGNWRQWKF